jgi:serine/threonine protein kinase
MSPVSYPPFVPSTDPVQFGRYLLDAKLAVGGMGEVFLARMKGPAGFEKTVVIKRVLPHLAQSPEFVRRFLDEGQLVAQLNHGNIVQVLDMGEENGQYFLTMEYVDGVDIRAVLRILNADEARMPLPIALHIMAEVAKGLAHAHSRNGSDGASLGIIHRDVSPSNVMISRDGEVKLLDFGIAKAEGRMVNSVSGSLHGKFLYMSPEQAAGRPLDKRSDLFSLGSLAYEMISGARPFKGSTEIETLELIRKGSFRPLSELRDDLPEPAEAIINKCMATDPDTRYSTGDALHDDLMGYLIASRTVVSNSEVAEFASSYVGPGAVVAPRSLDEALNQEFDAMFSDAARAPYGTQLAGDRMAVTDTGVAASGRDTSTTGRRALELPETDLPRSSRNRILLASVVLLVGILVTLNLVTLGELRKKTSIREISLAERPQSAAIVPNTGAEAAALVKRQDAVAPALEKVAVEAPKQMNLRFRDALPAQAVVSINGSPLIPDATGSYLVPSGEGPIRLRIEAPSKKPYDRELQREPGKVLELVASLEALARKVTIKSNPGAGIWIAGKKVGLGSHRVLVEPDAAVTGKVVLAGHITRTFEATFDGKEVINIKLKKRETGTLEVRVFPANAEVRIDGKIVKKASLQKTRLKIPVAPGKHQLAVGIPGGKTKKREFKIEPGKTTRLTQINLGE